MMESNKETITESVSPFWYRPGMRYIPVEYNTAGRRTLNEFVRDGMLKERELLIIRFLFELGEMTGHQIQMAFSHPLVDGRLKKVSAKGRNPYQSDINELVRKGLVHANRFLVNEKLSTKVYSLAKNCAVWFEESQRQNEHYYDTVLPVRFKPSKKECLPMLNHLAAVSYHIADICAEHTALSSYSPCFTEGASVFDAIYRYENSETVLLLAVRDPGIEKNKVLVALESSILKRTYSKLLFLTPNDTMMRELRELIKDAPDYSDEKVYYTTDMEIHFTRSGAPTVFRLDDNGQTAFSGDETEEVDDL